MHKKHIVTGSFEKKGYILIVSTFQIGSLPYDITWRKTLFFQC